MARVCACCTHPRRSDIDAALIAGRSLRAIGAHYGITPASLHRHTTNHLSAAISAAADAHHADVQSANLSVLQPVAMVLAPRCPSIQERHLAFHNNERAEPALVVIGHGVASSTPHPTPTSAPLDSYALACELRDNAINILRNAAASGDAKLALEATRTATALLDRLARLMPASSSSAAMPLAASPEWLALRATLLEALEPFPDARAAVATALVALS